MNWFCAILVDRLENYGEIFKGIVIGAGKRARGAKFFSDSIRIREYLIKIIYFTRNNS